MIRTKQDLKEYLKRDLGVYITPFHCIFKSINMWLRGTETIPAWNTLYALRHYEYYLNNKGRLSAIQKCIMQYWRFKFRHCQLRYDIHIEPNVIGPGVTIMHPGYRKIPSFVEIGENCTILPMVLIGRKKPTAKGKAIIGNNCYISTGVTILSPVKIGNNVTIGAGAVVTKDIPDNKTVAGVPASPISLFRHSAD